MPAQRRSNLIRRRRRVDDEPEEEASTAHEHAEDTQSEASVPSDVEQDADADDSDLSGTDAPASSLDTQDKPKPASKSASKATQGHVDPPLAPSASQGTSEPSFTILKDTDAMMNGLQVSARVEADNEALDFEALGGMPSTQPVIVRSDGQNENRRQELMQDRRRREHEDYKKKRDNDPAFIPTRGNFFMHDTNRAQAGQANGFRPFPGRGRGRGRNGISGPFSPTTAGAQAPDAASSQWTHDLHESLLEPEGKTQQEPPPRPQPAPLHIPSGPGVTGNAQATTGPARNAPPQLRSFSTTTVLGTVTARIFLPGMKEPKLASVRISQYAKLPNHRPPLRRDKPVRISLPERPPRYIFPSVERSFIFIPRALRPNQQGFGTRRTNRFGSVAGISSRRTSLYGGSVYSPSVVASRRSSIGRDFNREGLASPAGSIHGGPPVVRLPPGRSQQGTASGTPIHSTLVSGTGTPVSAVMPGVGFPRPQQPAYRETPANMQVHQPRPQKAVSVAGIESPAMPPFAPPQPQQDLPFHQQVPQHLNGAVPRPGSSGFYPGSQQMAFQPQPTAGTPLSHIPERAIHAPSFQPFHQQVFHQEYPNQPAFFYPSGSQPPYAPGAVIAPMLVPNQQGGYVIPTIAPAAPQAVQQAPLAPGHSNMVAYEQNGMVYYYDPAQLQVQAQNYAIPSMGGMMPPAQEGYLNYYPPVPQGTVYYPQQ